MIQKFFDSIFNGYYIGPIIFWETSTKRIGTTPVRGVERKGELLDTQIIIDGQQRVSSIYYALRSPNFKLEKESERTFFYIDFGEFLEPSSDKADIIKIFGREIDLEDQYMKLLFPLNRLEKYDSWLEDWSKFMEEKNPKLDFYKDVKPLDKILRTKLKCY